MIGTSGIADTRSRAARSFDELSFLSGDGRSHARMDEIVAKLDKHLNVVAF